jgi:tetratricopeptide (TPR) repeat protein
MENMKEQQQDVPVAGHFFGKWDWIAAAITFLISMTAFVYYMSPSVTLQDSGELVTGAYNFGVPHPPGYPLWAFLGWVWRYIVPIGNPAYRICLMSCFTGAAVTGLMTLLMTRSILTILRASPWNNDISESLKEWMALTVGSSVALLFAFNRGVWLWSCVPEMRVMSVFMFFISTVFLFAWMARPDRYGYLYVMMLLYALGIANHQTVIVMALPFLIGAFVVGIQEPGTSLADRLRNLHVFWELLFAFCTGWALGILAMSWLKTSDGGNLFAQRVPALLLFGPDVQMLPVLLLSCGAAAAIFFVGQNNGWLSPRRALICTLMAIIGISFYWYMPIAASTNPPMNWGYAATKQGFLHAVTRGQYEKIHVANLLGRAFLIQITLQIKALVSQFSLPVALFGLLPPIFLITEWNRFKARARSWIVFMIAAFFVALIGLLMVINPGLDKQQQEINIKFFAPAHGFYAMMIGYGMVLAMAWFMARFKQFPAIAVRAICVGLLALPLIPFFTNWSLCDQRGHDFGYQFGYRMFNPGGGYPPMEKDAVLFGGTDPGRFVPTYMIFCESFAKPGDKFADPNFDPEGGAKFDRRDVYIITQNALADGTYMSYIRDHYDFSRPNANDPSTIADRPAWQRAIFDWAWTALGRNHEFPKEPIYIPTERDLQLAFQQYVSGVQARMRRGEPMDPEEQVDIVGGQVQVRGVKGVMNINAILTKWIHDRNKDKHAFYVEESYVIPWMYPYMEPAGIILKINKEPLPSPKQKPELWKKIVARDTAYWDKLCSDFLARREFQNDSDAQKTFSKLRSAIGGLYLSREMYNEAIYAFKQAQRLCPDSPEANFRLSQLFMQLGRYDDAVSTLETYQLRDPLNDKIAMAIQQLRRLQEAMHSAKELEAQRAKSPRDLNLLVELVKTYGEMGQFDRVSGLCDSYLIQTNLPANDMLQVAQIFLSFRQLDRCMNALKLITHRHPQEANAYYALAMLYGAQDMQDPALDALEKAIQIAPNLQETARNDKRLASLRTNPRFQKLVGLPSTGFSGLPLFQPQPK